MNFSNFYQKGLVFLSFIFISNTPVSAKITEYERELLIIGALDQKIRTEYTYWDDVIRIDKENIATLKKLVKKYGFPTISLVGEKAHTAAFTVVQHGVSDLEFMIYFRNELKNRLKTNEVIDQYYAYLLDRTNIQSGLKQVYGTQGHCREKTWVPLPVDKPNQLPQLRKSVGLLQLSDFSKVVC